MRSPPTLPPLKKIRNVHKVQVILQNNFAHSENDPLLLLSTLFFFLSKRSLWVSLIGYQVIREPEAKDSSQPITFEQLLKFNSNFLKAS